MGKRKSVRVCYADNSAVAVSSFRKLRPVEAIISITWFGRDGEWKRMELFDDVGLMAVAANYDWGLEWDKRGNLFAVRIHTQRLAQPKWEA